MDVVVLGGGRVAHSAAGGVVLLVVLAPTQALRAPLRLGRAAMTVPRGEAVAFLQLASAVAPRTTSEGLQQIRINPVFIRS